MFLITMAGLSSRFFSAGYTVPKYQLKIGQATVFELSVRSFERYFNTDKFVFVVRDIFDTPKFVRAECEKMAISQYEVIVLNEETRGQAETAFLALEQLQGDEPLYIFNIDTFRHGFEKPEFAETCDGYLEVFHGEGENWSFVAPGQNGTVIRTTEKDRISDLCSDGLYHFRSYDLFRKIFTRARTNDERTRGEFYVAPLYNNLIADGGDVRYTVVDLRDIDFCGTPDEYSALLSKTESSIQIISGAQQ
ncbi:glycosyltransferase family 2 protein [Achromobacter marplatensis]|uniref:Glycosyltransferase family 2 protein n=1 Tax=Achromobacter marplatensis TaxID=470868 RepID=A0AA43AZM4_9BURK|nr:glycosyltransferase family 2 protein [Achromobacter marplatensis]MDH2050043.1 glycosyltransferase family 2 protein [Achromobacter marplatensis]